METELEQCYKRIKELEKENDFLKNHKFNPISSEQINLYSQLGQYEYFFEFDVNGNVISEYRSEECEKVTGYSIEDYKTNEKLWIEMVHHDDKIEVGLFIENLWRTLSSGFIEHRIIRKDGNEVWVANFCIIHKIGDIIKGSGLIIDINERKLGENAIAMLATIAKSASDAIISETLDGVVTSWNKGAENIYGYKAEEVLGNSISAIIPKNYKHEMAFILAQMKEGKSVKNFETIRCRKDGTFINVSLTISPIKNRIEQIVGASIISRDISEQKRIAKALEDSEKRLSAVLKSTPDIIMVLDCHYFIKEIYTANEKNLWLQKDELMEANLANLKIINEITNIIEKIKKWKQSDIPLSINFSTGNKAQLKYWSCLVSKIKYNKESEDENQIILAIRDNTEEMKTQKVKEDVQRIVRHDLKGPLNGILGFTHLLLKDQLSEKQRNRISKIYEASLHMLHMINYSLDLFRIEENSYPLHPVEFGINEILENIEELLLSERKEKNIEIINYHKNKKVNLKDENIKIYGEKTLLENMLMNLCKNAIEASPANEEIIFNIDDDEENHLISVQNKGMIPEGIQEHFFEAYSTTKKDGTGLGTYSAFLIVEVHKGKIGFKTSEELGTQINVSLPKKEKLEKILAEEALNYSKSSNKST